MGTAVLLPAVRHSTQENRVVHRLFYLRGSKFDSKTRATWSQPRDPSIKHRNLNSQTPCKMWLIRPFMPIILKPLTVHSVASSLVFGVVPTPMPKKKQLCNSGSMCIGYCTILFGVILQPSNSPLLPLVLSRLASLGLCCFLFRPSHSTDPLPICLITVKVKHSLYLNGRFAAKIHKKKAIMNNELLHDALQITKAAGDAIMGYYQASFDVKDKSPDNPVTEADFAADALLKERLLARLPEAGWLSEETVDSADRLDKKLASVADPPDATKEFPMGIPEFADSAAPVKHGQPVLRIIYNPPVDELFYAIKGGGVFFNGEAVTVTDRTEFAGSTVDASRSERKRGEFEPFEDVVDVRTMGGTAYKLARVAAGWCDVAWSRGPKNEWDICAGVLLVQESNGRCVNLDDEEFTFNNPKTLVNGFIADNGTLHQQVIAALAPHRHTARKN